MAIPQNYKNLRLSGDIEANGFLDQVTKVWCIVLQDINTEEMMTFHDYPEFCGAEVEDEGQVFIIPDRTGSLLEGARFLYKALNNNSTVAVHNCFGYDKFLLEKFWPKCITPVDSWEDTLILSKIQYFDRGIPKGAKGVHGLQPWGCRFGINKPDVEDWTIMTPFMLHRCIEDVKIQTKVTLYLEKERRNLESKLGIDMLIPYEIEKQYRINSTIRELNGAKVDREHIDRCIAELDNLTEELRLKIEPLLPKTRIVHGTKLALTEMLEVLGLSTENVYDSYETVVVNKQEVTKVVKPFYTPTKEWVKNNKTLLYYGNHPTYGKSLVYPTRKELTAWIKEVFPNTKQKDWGIVKEEIIHQTVKSNIANHFDCSEEDTELFGGMFTRISYVNTTMSQHDKVKEFLLGLGWKPDEWNYKKDPMTGQLMRDKITRELIPTAPKLTESSFKSLPDGLGKDIANYNTYSHRRKFLENPSEPDKKGIKAYIRPDGRITCGVNSYGAASGRA